MIALGFDDAQKDAAVKRYCAEHGIRKVFVLSPARFRFECSFDAVEYVDWTDIIRYRFYYRLLQEIDNATLVVVNECLRTQNRYDLTYNCIRNFLNQTRHQLVFQRLPIIDTFDDFMVLFDFDTRSRWKRESWRPEFRNEIELVIQPLAPTLRRIDVPTDAKTREAYAREKRKLIDNIGLRDPHTIPRNLHLFAGKLKLRHVAPEHRYVGRNNRFKLPNLETYDTVQGAGERTVFEFCHRFIDFADFLAATNNTDVSALVSDLKVDEWYFDRFARWTDRIRDAYAALHG